MTINHWRILSHKFSIIAFVIQIWQCFLKMLKIFLDFVIVFYINVSDALFLKQLTLFFLQKKLLRFTYLYENICLLRWKGIFHHILIIIIIDMIGCGHRVPVLLSTWLYPSSYLGWKLEWYSFMLSVSCTFRPGAAHPSPS